MDKSIYLLLTDLTILLHLMFIVFVVAGGFYAKGKRWMIVFHLAAVVWSVYAELSPGVICPLTELENYFGSLAGLSTYQEDFVARYLIPIIYQEGLTPAVQYILVGLVVLINVIAYTVKWKRMPK